VQKSLELLDSVLSEFDDPEGGGGGDDGIAGAQPASKRDFLSESIEIYSLRTWKGLLILQMHLFSPTPFA